MQAARIKTNSEQSRKRTLEWLSYSRIVIGYRCFSRFLIGSKWKPFESHFTVLWLDSVDFFCCFFDWFKEETILVILLHCDWIALNFSFFWLVQIGSHLMVSMFSSYTEMFLKNVGGVVVAVSHGNNALGEMHNIFLIWTR